MSDEQDRGILPPVSRRTFLSTAGLGTLGTLAPAIEAAADAAAPVAEAGAKVGLTLRVNGRALQLSVEPRTTLLTALREGLGFTGTKPGCERGECGACTVLIDGVARYSCLTLALEAEGHEIITIEGLAQGETLSPVQQAFVDEDAYQCGYCTPGQVMTAEGLLQANPDPSLDQVREGMSGNLCRCGAYAHIFKAVRRAAQARRAAGGAR
jgi:xanthine dehydrogenase YagT iron-sulfur-binding subunit